jgi:hypothetical protein
MGNNQSITASARVDEDIFTHVEGELERKGEGKSSLIQAAFRLYAEDSWARDFFDLYFSDEVDSFEEYAVKEVRNQYGLKLTDGQKKELQFGINSIISGMQNRNEYQALEGCDVLAIVDQDLAEDAAEYIQNVQQSGYFD